ncbi:hypothetical protein L1987_73406 [Smallanthus sonchifolius]|uniref:Uncharacterized protein n=1 Tax=Smallanthus sonchifolius TaxID=185202 RepID=A0ACB9A0L5_9ASTR|nr:hypothetical protein L1987_73406 [Smallanthus sonchifolius]
MDTNQGIIQLLPLEVKGKDITELIAAGRDFGEKRKELVVPKEGFDDQQKVSRTVFVGNLPLKVKKKAKLREFNQFREIGSIRIRYIPSLDASVLEYDAAQASLSHNMAFRSRIAVAARVRRHLRKLKRASVKNVVFAGRGWATGRALFAVD